jgi:hypothetical protein
VDRLFDVAIQVPGMALIAGVFLMTLTRLLDFFRDQFARRDTLVDKAIDAMEEAARRFDARN